jgi:type IV secretion system protein VirD4
MAWFARKSAAVAAAPTLPLTPFERRFAAQPWAPRYPAPRSTTYGDARLADLNRDAAAMKAALGTGSGVWFGTMYQPGQRARDIRYIGDRHLLTIAPTGSGKGTCAIIPNLLMQQDISIICIDPKGQNAAITGRSRLTGGKPAYFLNPFNEHGIGTSRFNPLAALSINSPNVTADVASLAEALIFDEGKEPFFTDSARDLVRTIILHLLATKGPAATLPEMRRLLTLPRGEGAADEFGILIFEMMESTIPAVKQAAARFQHIDRTTQSIISVAIAQTSFLDDPGIINVLNDNDFHIRDFKTSLSTLYLILPDRYMRAYSRFLRLIVMAALNQLSASRGGHRVLFILDEFPLLGRLSAIEEAFRLGRGHNIQLWPFVQSINDLEDIYEKRWESFIANAGLIQWFTPNDHGTTADYLSKRIGKTTITAHSYSDSHAINNSAAEGGSSGTTMSFSSFQQSRNFGRSTNRSTSFSETRSQSAKEEGVDFLSPQDLLEMPDYFQILTLAGLKFPILSLREPYYQWHETIRGSYIANCDPDPFQQNGARQDISTATITTLVPTIGPGLPTQRNASQFNTNAITPLFAMPNTEGKPGIRWYETITSLSRYSPVITTETFLRLHDRLSAFPTIRTKIFYKFFQFDVILNSLYIERSADKKTALLVHAAQRWDGNANLTRAPLRLLTGFNVDTSPRAIPDAEFPVRRPVPFRRSTTLTLYANFSNDTRIPLTLTVDIPAQDVKPEGDLADFAKLLDATFLPWVGRKLTDAECCVDASTPATMRKFTPQVGTN